MRLVIVLLSALSLSFLTVCLEPSARYSWPGWFPSVDGKTLTDYPLRLLNAGKIAKVPVMSELVGLTHRRRSSLECTDGIVQLAMSRTNKAGSRRTRTRTSPL